MVYYDGSSAHAKARAKGFPSRSAPTKSMLSRAWAPTIRKIPSWRKSDRSTLSAPPMIKLLSLICKIASTVSGVCRIPRFDRWHLTCRPMTTNKVVIDQMDIQPPLQTFRRLGVGVCASSKGAVATTGGRILSFQRVGSWSRMSCTVSGCSGCGAWYLGRFGPRLCFWLPLFLILI